MLIDQKDQVSLVLLHCFFHDGYEVITHVTHEFDEQLYKRLPNLYAVWMADNNPGEDKRLVAGFLFKTNSTHSDPEFKDVLHHIVVSYPNLRARLNHRSSFLPTRLVIRGEAPLSEEEMLSVLLGRFTAFRDRQEHKSKINVLPDAPANYLRQAVVVPREETAEGRTMDDELNATPNGLPPEFCARCDRRLTPYRHVHARRKCETCDLNYYVREYGPDGRSVVFEPYDDIVYPVRAYRLSMRPENGARLTPSSIAEVARLMFFSGLDSDRNSIELFLEQCEGEALWALTTYTTKHRPIVENQQPSVEEIVEEILNRSDRDPATPEFWACFLHTAAEAVRFAIKEGQTTVAAWTAAQLAASRAMLVFIRDLQEMVWRGYTVENLRAVLELWNQNHDNDDENFWQSTLDMNPIILSQLFAAPIIVLQGKAYLGGAGIGNAGANLSDYLIANKLTKNVALIEIKTPRTKLLGAKYRGLFNASPQLTGAVLQISNYRDSLLKNYHSLRAESDQPFVVTDPRCIVIAGTLRKEIGDDRKRLHSFELFREGLRNVQVITYDELFHKVKVLIELLQGRAEDVQSAEAPLGEKRDDTVPHRRKRSQRTSHQSGRRQRSGTKGNN